MKRILRSFITIFTFASFASIAYLMPAKAASTNLIINPSVEATDSSGWAPQGWTQDSWGTNTRTFQYLSSGQEGAKSVYVKITNFQNGDAKWSHDPVVITPNTDYVFSDYYKGTVATYFIARYFDVSGKAFYTDYGQADPAASWTNSTISFKTPANAVKMTMLHLLGSNGELWTDNYSITKYEAPALNGSIPNSSFEQASYNSSIPLGWQKSKWGKNSASFAYLSTGHTGSRSVKVTVSNYTDGDAKWSYEPQSVTPGGYYRFTDYYQSNISTQVAIEVIKSDGTEDYLPLHNAPVSATWAKYTAAFRVPNDVVKVALIHMVVTNGYLVTDDYSLVSDTPRSFSRPLLTMTFDDGWEDNYQAAFPRLEAYGLKTTQCYATTFVQGTGKEYIIKDIYNKGHEICSHSVTHPDLTTVSNTKLDNELKNSKQYLESIVGIGKVTAFAAPYGSYNDKVLTYAQKYYKSYRSTDAGYNTRDNFDFYNVKVQNILNTTQASEVQSWINEAKATNTWLVIVYHVVTNQPDEYDTTPALFEQHLQVIKNSGITVLPYNQALNEVSIQL